MTAYPTLREANRARAAIWGKGQIDLDWRLNELAGEVGEVCNVLKKIERERQGEPGSRVTVYDLGAELADVLICLDLAMMKLEEFFQVSLDTPASYPSTIPHGMRGSGVEAANAWGIGLFLVTGSFVTWQVPHIHEEYGEDTTVLAPIVERIQNAQRWAAAIEEWVFKINDIFCPHPMEHYVEGKFNATSAKVKIPIYLDFNSGPRPATERIV